MLESPLRRSTRGFTLVELLVVISLIALLVALLLPSLRIAMREAAKANCLTRVRGLGQASVMFATDNKLQLPSPVFNYNTGNRDIASYQFAAQDAATRLWDSNGNYLFPSGTLALKGYVQDPRNFFCPTFTRTATADNLWDAPSSTNTLWRTVTTGQYPVPTWSAVTGYTEHFFAYATGTEMDAGLGTYSKVGSTRLDYVEQFWNRRPSWGTQQSAARGWYSPVFYTCGNYNKGGLGRPAVDITGNCHVSSQGGSIIREGVNAVFFDGSSRWISREETFRLGGNNPSAWDVGAPADWLTFHYPLNGSGHRWMRMYATLVKPN